MATGDDDEHGTQEITSSDRGRPYHHGDLRAALIRAGLTILAEEGVQALTLRAAARRAGVSHNAPYRHFADKQALLAAIAEEGFVELADWLEEVRARARPTAQAQLEDTGWMYVRFVLTHVDHLRVMFGSLIAEPQAYPSLWAAGVRACDILVGILRTGQGQGAIVGGNPRQLAFGAWAMVHGLALLLIDRQVPRELSAAERAESLVRRCLRQQFAGLRTSV